MKVARTRVPKQCEFDAMVGANLQYIRKFRKLSMKKVGEQVPFTFQQLQKYEKGRNTISAYKLTKLCGIYKVNIADIVNETFIENHQKSLTPPLEEIKDNLKKDGIDWRDTVLPASPDNDIEDEAIEMMDKEHFERQLRK
jgi:transcriptional regulator with XRE-family HTH domain|tara:strand:- start:263 stop:682 length:420 start_codon:yes stop_codon:yes gene_type:complete